MASYQVSGIPWVSSSIAPSSGDIVSFRFPQVTKFVTTKNTDTVASIIRIGFDIKQIEYETGEYFELSNGECISVETRTIDIHIQSKDAANIPFNVVAGLTNIARSEMPLEVITSDIKLLSEQTDMLTTENNFNIIVE